MGIIFTKVLTIFLLVVIGFVANRLGRIPESANQYLINILLDITMPCMIMTSIISNTLDAETMRVVAEVMIGSLIFFLVEWPVAILFLKLIRYEPRSEWGVLIVIISGVNTGFMGFPVTKMLFGNEYFFYMAMENIVLGIYLYFIMVIQLNSGEGKRPKLMDTFRGMWNNCMIVSVVAMVMLALGITLPGGVIDFLNMVGDATVPLSMMVVGVQLGRSSIRKLLRNVKLMLASLFNVMGIPALTLLAVHWLPITDKAKLILVFAAAFPCAVIAVAMAAREHKNATRMAEGVVLTTLLSMASLPFWAMVVTHLYL